jgi:hypothetical protein
MFDPQLFPHNNEIVDADLYKGGIFLGCEFGLVALYVWVSPLRLIVDLCIFVF